MPHIILKIWTVSEFLADEGRDFHKLGPAIFILNFLISSRPYIAYKSVIYITQIMIMYVSISLKIVPEYTRNVAM